VKKTIESIRDLNERLYSAKAKNVEIDAPENSEVQRNLLGKVDKILDLLSRVQGLRDYNQTMNTTFNKLFENRKTLAIEILEQLENIEHFGHVGCYIKTAEALEEESKMLLEKTLEVVNGLQMVNDLIVDSLEDDEVFKFLNL